MLLGNIDTVDIKIKINTVLFGETGANPVRARRRKAHMKYRQPDRKPQCREKSLEHI